ncbi:hypothetical protein DSO57_1027109 [Entomophthora muscae]|uniref:Uncharacterized protein n=1 Tax=Entomophthora muscae TaxID=34485 RepID=A0ACC2TD31_9FUNG|nr:hypothetical protein DSO57_1027109 [Entomophthora muscae]
MYCSSKLAASSLGAVVRFRSSFHNLWSVLSLVSSTRLPSQTLVSKKPLLHPRITSFSPAYLLAHHSSQQGLVGITATLLPHIQSPVGVCSLPGYPPSAWVDPTEEPPLSYSQASLPGGQLGYGGLISIRPSYSITRGIVKSQDEDWEVQTLPPQLVPRLRSWPAAGEVFLGSSLGDGYLIVGWDSGGGECWGAGGVSLGSWDFPSMCCSLDGA